MTTEPNQGAERTEPVKDIGSILTEGRAEQPVQEARAPTGERAPVTQDQPNAADVEAHGEGEPKQTEWTFKAYEKERKRRQALSSRVKELEAENEALLAAQSHGPEVDPAETQYWLNPHEAHAEQSIRLNGRASKAEFVAEYGKSTFEELDRAVAAAAHHPDMPMLSQMMRQSPDPVGVMARWASEVLGWQPGQQAQAQAQQSAPAAQRPVMPSNFAAVRNVGVRSGPAWAGPSPLQDIFSRRR